MVKVVEQVLRHLQYKGIVEGVSVFLALADMQFPFSIESELSLLLMWLAKHQT